jgi:ornithine carbamoyltransferase
MEERSKPSSEWETGGRTPAEIDLRDDEPGTDAELVVEEIDAAPHRAGGEGEDLPPEGLFPTPEAAELRTRWRELQARFVDEPREAVQAADGLVTDVMRRLSERFTEERNRLEAQWSRGDEVSTEDLRVALQRYRSFLERLLEA